MKEEPLADRRFVSLRRQTVRIEESPIALRAEFRVFGKLGVLPDSEGQLLARDGEPCIVSYISCTRAMTRCSIPAEMSGKSWAACVSKRMKHAIASGSVGARCFFSSREMTSGLSHPKR